MNSRPTHQPRLRALRAQASTAIPVARHRRGDLAGGRLGPHRSPYLPSSTRNLKATQTPPETPQIHDAKTLLKDLHFLTWVDWAQRGFDSHIHSYHVGWRGYKLIWRLKERRGTDLTPSLETRGRRAHCANYARCI